MDLGETVEIFLIFCNVPQQPLPSKNQLTMLLPSKIISVFDAWPILLRAYTFCSVPNYIGS